MPARRLALLACCAALAAGCATTSALTADHVKTGNAKTARGANVAVAKAGAFVTVDDAMVQTEDIQATNGVVHTVDRVLMPPRR